MGGRFTARRKRKASQQFEDLELTRRSQAGDADAFGELVTKYRTKIFIMVCDMVRNEHDAWDLAHGAGRGSRKRPRDAATAEASFFLRLT